LFKVYGSAESGNCYKVKLALECLQLPHEWSEVDIIAGETRTPEFLERKPGYVPMRAA